MRILVVDDERMICEWLSFCIENNPGCELAGVAHNGEQGLAMFRERGADVVFTDIKMPVMGGLELLKKVKELSPETMVVMLTAFAEFEIVREALRLGGDHYLLKTEMNNQSFKEVLKELEARRWGKKAHSSAELEATGQQHSIVGEILKKGHILDEEDIKTLKSCNIRWRDKGLFALAVSKHQLLKGFVLPENSMVRHVTGFEYDCQTYVIVGNMERNLSELKKIQLLHDFANAIVGKNQCTVGVSAITDSLSRVTDAIAEAVCGFGLGYYSGNIKAFGSPVPGPQVKESCKQWEEYYRRQRHEMYELDGSEFYRRLLEVMEVSQREKAFPVNAFTAFCCNAMEMAHARFGHEDAPLMCHMMADIKLAVCQSLCFLEVKDKILDFVNHVLMNQDIDESRLSKGVAGAVGFIRKHYGESISLEQISQEVHLNSEYLSRIFKEEVGCTYSSFLSETRLKKAAYLLTHTSERIQKIAEQVGYPNVSYFSTTFKKRYGINPYEYRRGE